MSAVKLASRYAKSLLDLAIQQDKLYPVYEDMQYFKKVVEESREFELLLKSPIINADKKLKVLKAVFAGKNETITNHFIEILVKKGRERYLADIAAAFIHQYNRFQGITEVTLRSATALNKDTVTAILDKVKQEANLDRIELTQEIDPELVGGFVIQFGDQLYDASVARKLELLRQEFSENKYIKTL